MPPPATSPDVIEIVDAIAWGKLVKDWACARKPRPTSIADLKSQAAGAVDVPASITGLVVVQGSENTLVLHLPTASMTVAMETALQAGGDYVIPAFYDDAYNVQLSLPQNQKLDFHACRIGDYSVGNCA